MKALKTITNKIVLTTGTALGILLLTTTMLNAKPVMTEKDSTNVYTEIELIEMEVEEILEMESNEILIDLNLFQEPMIKIYDNNDVLIYEGIDHEGMDARIKGLIYQSDFIMSHENTTFYKLNR